MNNLYKPVPIERIQSYAASINDGGKPLVYRQIRFDLDEAKGTFTFPVEIRFVKGLRIEQLSIAYTDTSAVPVVYIHSSQLASVLSYGAVNDPVSAVNANGADCAVHLKSSFDCIGATCMATTLESGVYFSNYISGNNEFLPCRGSSIQNQVDLEFRGWASASTTDIVDLTTNVGRIHLTIGVMCEDQIRA
jgi:hypothetical protein